MCVARMHQRSGRGACNAAGRPLVHALPCGLLAAPAASWGEIGYSTVLRVGPHLEIPTRVPYSASRAAGEPPAPGAKVFTENVRHLGSFIEKRPLVVKSRQADLSNAPAVSAPPFSKQVRLGRAVFMMKLDCRECRSRA